MTFAVVLTVATVVGCYAAVHIDDARAFYGLMLLVAFAMLLLNLVRLLVQ